MLDDLKKEIRSLKLGKYDSIHIKEKENQLIVTISTTGFDDIVIDRVNDIQRDIRRLAETYNCVCIKLADFQNDTSYRGLIRYNRKLKIEEKIKDEPIETKELTYRDEFGNIYPINDFGEIQYDMALDEK